MDGTNIIWVERFIRWDVGIKRHTHNYYQLYYLHSGECSFVHANTEYHLQQGYGIFTGPDVAHEVKSIGNSAAVMWEIKFNVDDEDLKQDLSLLNKPVPFDDYASGIVEYVLAFGRSRLPYYKKSCQCFFNSLVFYLSRESRAVGKEELNSQLIDTSGFLDLSTRIIIYLEENYSSDISLDLLADKVGYSKNYICYVFKKDTGFTIINYLNFIRIRLAAELFSYSNCEISHICHVVGFKNISHFNHTFKQFVGIPPGLYRRMFPADIYKRMDGNKLFPRLISNQVLTLAHLFGTLPDDPRQ